MCDFLFNSLPLHDPPFVDAFWVFEHARAWRLNKGFAWQAPQRYAERNGGYCRVVRTVSTSFYGSHLVAMLNLLHGCIWTEPYV